MARAFTALQQISGSYGSHMGQTYLTMACWVRRAASSIQVFGSSDVANNATVVSHYSNNILYVELDSGSLAYSYVEQNITGWNHIAFVFDGSQAGNNTRLKTYVNGVDLAANYFGTIPNATSNNAGVGTLRLGRNEKSNYGSTGDYAEFAMWQSALSDVEIASLGKGITPDNVRPQSLAAYIPLVRDIQDIRSGTTLTNSGTTVADHPRTYS